MFFLVVIKKKYKGVGFPSKYLFIYISFCSVPMRDNLFYSISNLKKFYNRVTTTKNFVILTLRLSDSEILAFFSNTFVYKLILIKNFCEG